MRRAAAVAVTTLTSLAIAAPAWACGALIGPNGAVQLAKTTTLAAYHDGVEHYITSFEFSGGGAEFGSIVPLPDVPTRIRKGGDWTLQRLVQEVTPQERLLDAAAGATSAPRADAVVLMERQVGALDITVLEGGGDAVGRWAEDNGFSLTPDAPEALDFYAQRSPIFMAVRFDLRRAQEAGQQVGDGTPIHLTIPTDDPWVPLRILGVGLAPDDRVRADVFLLTDEQPNLLPAGRDGVTLSRSEAASDALMLDLAEDRGMRWMPDEMWLSYLELDIPAADLTFDLAVDPTGTGVPSPVDAGFALPAALDAVLEAAQSPWVPVGIGLLVVVGLVGGGLGLRRLGRPVT